MYKKNYDKIKNKLIDWIQKKVNKSGTSGVVVGLSGGIDSSVTGVLAKKAFPDNFLGVIMPCESAGSDRRDALKLVEKFDIEYEIIDLEDVFVSLSRKLPGISVPQNKMARANIKPRLRMTVLYYFANLNNYLVVGTGNRSELELGYFTKYGDGGVDIEPIGNLLKTEVKKLAEVLNIPETIINKPPSAGLWAGQKDEQELKLSYEEIDNYILGRESSKEIKQRIEKLKKQNKHKLKAPQTPSF